MRNNAFPIAYTAFAVFGFYEGLIGVSWPAMSLEFGVSLDAVGVLFMVSLVGFVLVSFASGSLIRRRNIHWLVLTSILFRVAGFLGVALAPNWPLLVLSIFILSLGGGGLDTSLNGFVTARGSARQLNWLHACFGVGATLGPFLAAAVAALGGSWRWNFGILAVMLGATAMLIRISEEAWKVAPLKEASEPGKHVSLGQTMRLPIVWISTLTFFLYTGTELAAGQWSFTLFALGRGVTELAARFWVGIYWGAFTIGRLAFGFVADRVNIDRVLRYAIAAVVAGAGLLWWNPLPWVAFAGLTLMGLAQAPVFPGLIQGTPKRAGVAHTANTMGLQIGIAGLGGTTLAGLIGVLATWINLEMIGLSLFVFAGLTLICYQTLLVMSGNKKSGR